MIQIKWKVFSDMKNTDTICCQITHQPQWLITFEALPSTNVKSVNAHPLQPVAFSTLNRCWESLLIHFWYSLCYTQNQWCLNDWSSAFGNLMNVCCYRRLIWDSVKHHHTGNCKHILYCKSIFVLIIDVISMHLVENQL